VSIVLIPFLILEGLAMGEVGPFCLEVKWKGTRGFMVLTDKLVGK
jgi:hypothetical protein